MDFLSFLSVFALGAIFMALLIDALHKPKLEITLLLKLDSTLPVKISATGKDSEGNPIDISSSELVLQATPTNDKNFGEINDDNDTFNPGEAGATGTITGTVTINGVEYSASVDVELEAGALSELALEFAPA